ERTGWVVVDQVPLSAALGSYAWALGLILLASLAIWLALAWNLRGQLQRHVVTPLVQLGRGTSALANGDFSRGKALASIPAAFAELTALATDFQHMSDALETRQAKLQESETRFRTFVEKANDIIYSISLDGIFTYASPNWKELLGHEVNEVVGQSFEPFVHPDDLASCRAILKRVVVNGEKVSGFEYRVQHKNGIWYWHSSNASAIYDAGGRIVSFLGIARNITERKHAEEEIKKLNAELEQRVADRTAQLEAANKELDAFAYSVSHDLRAPLRHIDGFLDLLKNRLPNLDEKSLHYMTNISSSATRMGTLIDDLLSFSRMGRQEMSNTRVDLASLVREVIRELEPDAQNRSIHWHIADLPTVTGDRAMLRVVLVNFLSNALKFTQLRQQAEIEIGCQSQETETIIFVRDNGVGFDPRYADKLFGVFQRLHRADEFEGTGIGLANVQRIINRHGGRIWAEGAVNQGATFYFSLP
ncbi:partial Phytochrome-like protein cph1, partial [Gammaproteobacteria bacterium]